MSAHTETTSYVPVGENVEYAVAGDELTIKIDLSHRGGLSASGKTIRVATTNGNKDVGDGVFVGLNAYVYAQPRK